MHGTANIDEVVGLSAVREELHRLALVEGSMFAVSQKLAVHEGILSRVVHGKMAPPPQLLRALGFKRNLVYERGG